MEFRGRFQNSSGCCRCTCCKCNKIANSCVGEHNTRTSLVGGRGGWSRCPLLEVTDSRQFYDPLRRECAPALWLQNFIWFNMESVVKFAYIPRPTLTILKFMIFLLFFKKDFTSKNKQLHKILDGLERRIGNKENVLWAIFSFFT